MELTLGARGADFLDDVSKIGFVELDTLVDNLGGQWQVRPLPLDMVHIGNGWMAPNRDKVGSGLGQPVSVPVALIYRPETQVNPPKGIPNQIKSVQGRYKMRLATEEKVISIDRISQNLGVIDLPELQQMGLEIMVFRPDEGTLLVQASGNTSDLIDASVEGQVGEMGKLILFGQERSYVQFNFLEKIPADLSLKIRLFGEGRELTVPFEFQGISVER